MTRAEQVVKRLLDFLFALVVLVFFWPIFILLFVIVKLDSPGPGIFRQKRLGKDGKPFTCFKFRTMIEDAPHLRKPDGSAYTGKDDPRITRAGRFLRKTSLDELPQFLNVLKGDMSMVGPRPEQVDQVRFYSERQKKRLLVKPGMTSWAMIHGRNTLPWEQRLDLDAEYVENYSLWLDVRVFMLTLPILLSTRGAFGPQEEIQSGNDVPDGPH
jgi:undecaprenyl phosphate N,N'-diacetylbacillosamine 1-phosphate transferase